MSEPVVTPGVDTTVNSEHASVPAEEPQEPAKTLERRAEFFMTLIYFSVEDKVYSIPDSMFPGQGYFKSAIEPIGGNSESEPLKLDTTVSQMDSLLSVLLARHVNSLPELNISQWGEALALATLWKLDAARNFIIDHITRHFPDHLADRIKMADDFDVTQWLYPAYEKICTRSTPLTEEEVTALGPKRLVALLKIREACRQPEKRKTIPMSCGSCGKTFHIGETPASVQVTCRSCGWQLEHTPAVQEPLPTTSNADNMIKASVELRLDSAGEPPGVDNITTVKATGGIEVSEECCHEFLWQPNGCKATKVKKVDGITSILPRYVAACGTLCSRICGKCGVSE
ncbi:hypothetical protein FRB94_012287 [Tulasnella sp. JGI-2019a]|nr:hypothetical protein FRB94_012287 [Tulasnella sp. JGI-2019a]